LHDNATVKTDASAKYPVAMDSDTLHVEFAGELYSWRGPAPYHFIKVPEEACVDLRAVSPFVSYGWGLIPVWVRIGGIEFETSCFPRTEATSCRLRTSSATPKDSPMATP
jgi:hypothetical protein